MPRIWRCYASMHLRLKWPLGMGFHFLALHANKCVHHFQSQRPNALLFLTGGRQQSGNTDIRIHILHLKKAYMCVAYKNISIVSLAVCLGVQRCVLVLVKRGTHPVSKAASDLI